MLKKYAKTAALREAIFLAIQKLKQGVAFSPLP